MGYSITHFSQKAILLFYFCNKYVIIEISMQQKHTKKAAVLQIFHTKQQLLFILSYAVSIPKLSAMRIFLRCHCHTP